MKILYSVQATGNGHISRALDVLPYLKKYGEVDIFLSGANNTLDMPNVMYRSKGMSFFYNKKGGLDYRKTLSNFKPFRLVREARDLPVYQYDAVINDFEPITSLACAMTLTYCVGFGHQASFQYPNVPRAKAFAPIGKFALNNYAICDDYVGLHFKSYDWDNVFNPILNDQIVEAAKGSQLPSRNGQVLVYLPSYSGTEIYNAFSKFPEMKFDVVNKVPIHSTPSFQFHTPDKNAFRNAIINCSTVVTSAGFETPAEALYLGKKLMVIPIKGQYEQACNARALEDDYGVFVARDLNDAAGKLMETVTSLPPRKLVLAHSTEHIVDVVMKKFQ